MRMTRTTASFAAIAATGQTVLDRHDASGDPQVANIDHAAMTGENTTAATAASAMMIGVGNVHIGGAACSA